MTSVGCVGHGSSTAIIQSKDLVGGYKETVQHERAPKVENRGNRKESKQGRNGVSREGVPSVTSDRGSLSTDPALTHRVDVSELAEFDKESENYVVTFKVAEDHGTSHTSAFGLGSPTPSSSSSSSLSGAAISDPVDVFEEDFTEHGDELEPDDSGVPETPNDGPPPRTNIEEICRMALVIAGDTISEEEIRVMLTEARKATSGIYDKEDAIAAGRDFKFRSDISDRDTQRFIDAGGSLKDMVRTRQFELLHDRLNLARIEATLTPGVHDESDVQLLRELAEKGIHIIVDEIDDSAERFTPRSDPDAEPLRSLYVQVQGVVNAGMQKQWEQDELFIIPTEMAIGIPGIHYTPIHWGPKNGHKGGRPLFDAKANKMGSALNSRNAKAALKLKYKEIKHPTIETVILMILLFVDEKMEELGDAFSWDDLVLWKCDLANAFGQLFFQPEDVHLMASALTDLLTVIYYCGQFGWTGLPYAFQVVTRILKAEIRHRIGTRGKVEMLCDDVMAVCLERDQSFGMAVATAVINGAMGSRSIASHKWISGKVCEMLGYDVDLIRRHVTMCPRNHFKTMCGFLDVDTTRPISLGVLEKLCSWSARYTIILRVLKALTNILYGEKRGRHGSQVVSIKLTALGRIAVKVWCVMLILLRLRASTYARPLDSFRKKKPRYQIEYDASLRGLGVLIRDLELYDPGDPKSGIMQFAWMTDLPFNLKDDPSYQNTAEFIAVTMGMVLLARLGIRGESLKFKGDNTTSLKWGSTQLFKGKFCRRTSFVYMMLAVHFDLWVSEDEHVAGLCNVVCDDLSRGKMPRGFDSRFVFDMGADHVVRHLVELCDPTPENEISDENDFMNFWVDIRDSIAKLVPV